MFFDQMFDLVVVDIICAEELRVSYKPHYGSSQGNVQWPHSGMERCRSVSPYFISCRVFQGNPVVGGGGKEGVCQDKVISEGQWRWGTMQWRRCKTSMRQKLVGSNWLIADK